MPINAVIRNRRKELELTQEQLADALGVSVPAVSKWENGFTCPDIGLLPPLARMLRIDVNTLLCFEDNLTAREISQFSTKILHRIEKDGFDAGFSIAIEKIREYPNCAELQQTLAVLLEGALMFYGSGLENREQYGDQIFSLYERAASGDDEKTRSKAQYMLVSKYIQKKEYEKAQQILDLLPERSALNKKQLQANLLIVQNQFEEAFILLERKLLKEINEVQSTLLTLVDAKLAADKVEEAEELSELLGQMISLFGLWKYGAHITPLQIAVKRKKVDESLTQLKLMLDNLINPWFPQDSYLFRHILNQTTAQESAIPEIRKSLGEKMLPALLSDLESNLDFDYLRSNPEYQRILDDYTKKVKES